MSVWFWTLILRTSCVWKQSAREAAFTTCGFIIARQCNACTARYCRSKSVRPSVCPPVCPSVCPPVCPVPVLCLNKLIYRQTFWQSGTCIILVLASPPLQNSKGNPSAGVRNIRGGRILQLSSFISETIRDKKKEDFAYRQLGPLRGSWSPF